MKSRVVDNVVRNVHGKFFVGRSRDRRVVFVDGFQLGHLYLGGCLLRVERIQFLKRTEGMGCNIIHLWSMDMVSTGFETMPAGKDV